MKSSNKPRSSAILAVYNSAATIQKCLESLLTQSTPIEIIIVDDGSTDNTKKLIHQIANGNSTSRVQVFSQPHRGPAHARNYGASFARTDILLFVDADMTFGQDYVKDLINPIIHHNSNPVIGTYTSNEVVSNWDNVWARCWNIQEGWAPRVRFRSRPPRWGTDFRAILKKEFDRVGGFDDIGYTDTWTLFNKLGKRPLITNALCYHQNPSSLVQVFRQAKWAAKRPYKRGLIGTFIALIRTSLPVSILAAVYQSAKYQNLSFIIFKLVYDFGRFCGITTYQLTGSKIK